MAKKKNSPAKKAALKKGGIDKTTAKNNAPVSKNKKSPKNQKTKAKPVEKVVEEEKVEDVKVIESEDSSSSSDSSSDNEQVTVQSVSDDESDGLKEETQSKNSDSESKKGENNDNNKDEEDDSSDEENSSSSEPEEETAVVDNKKEENKEADTNDTNSFGATKKQDNDDQLSDTNCTLFIKNVSFDTSINDIKTFFTNLNDVIKTIKVFSSKNPKHTTGFAEIEFADNVSAKKALEKDGEELNDCSLNIVFSKEAPNSRMKRQAGGFNQNNFNKRQRFNNSDSSFNSKAKPDNCTRIFVGNLPYEITEEEISDFFSGCGPISNVNLSYDHDMGRSKGFAHVEFESTESVDNAINLNDECLGDRPVKVDYAFDRRRGGGNFKSNRFESFHGGNRRNSRAGFRNRGSRGRYFQRGGNQY